MGEDGVPSTRLVLNCSPARQGDRLVFSYSVLNGGPADAYLMDALPVIDRETGEARAGADQAVVIQGRDGDVILGRFAAPLPTDRRVAVPVLPLGRRIPSGTSCSGKLELPLPLAETSPYFADLPLRSYEVVGIRSIIFMLGYWTADTEGLVAMPVAFAPELFQITTRRMIASARRIWQVLPTSGLQLFKRTDAFPRPASPGG
jgi:hypothetical protein